MMKSQQETSFFEHLESATTLHSMEAQRRSAEELQRLFDRMRFEKQSSLHPLRPRSFDGEPLGERS